MLFRSTRFLLTAPLSPNNNNKNKILILAQSSLANNLPDQALKYLDDVKKSNPSEESVDYLRALSFAQKNDPMAARQSVLEELRHHPGNTEAQDLSRLLRQQLRQQQQHSSSSLFVLDLPYEMKQLEPEFAMCYNSLLDHTMLDADRLFSLWTSTREVVDESLKNIENSKNEEVLIVECGTAGGGSLMLMGCSAKLADSSSSASSKKGQGNNFKLVSFDTFSGMPSPTDKDKLNSSKLAESTHWADGTCSSGSEEPIHNLARAFCLDKHLVTVPGLFEDTLPKYFNNNNEKRTDNEKKKVIKMLHIDCDWYESTKQCLEILWPHLEVGGKFQIDDFMYWDGCKQAVQEFFSTLKVQPKCNLSSVALCGTKMG